MYKAVIASEQSVYTGNCSISSKIVTKRNQSEHNPEEGLRTWMLSGNYRTIAISNAMNKYINIWRWFSACLLSELSSKKWGRTFI